MRDVKERSRRQEENREKMDAVPLFQFFDFFSPLDVVDLPAQLFLVSSLFPSRTFFLSLLFIHRFHTSTNTKVIK